METQDEQRTFSIADGKTDITDVPSRMIVAQAGDVCVSDDGRMSRQIKGFLQPEKWSGLLPEERRTILDQMPSDVRERFVNALMA